MPTTSKAPRSPREALLTRLLEAHERSKFFGHPGPWTREVIAKLDAKTFPEAFGPEGRDCRAALIESARTLERQGCARLVHVERGPLAGEPREVRLGPGHVEAAYTAASAFGFEPLRVGLDAMATRASACALVSSSPPWMRERLQSLARAPLSGLDSLGMTRDRFKREWRELVLALEGARTLSEGVRPAWERVISERVFNDSKVLWRVRSHVVAILVLADPRWDGIPPDEAEELLEVYGVRRKPGLIRCAGSFQVDVSGRTYRAEDFAPVAHLPDAWSEAWIDGLVRAGTRTVTTVENEYPFLSYVEERGGHDGLGRDGEVVVYVAGFPTPALVSTLSTLATRSTSVCFRHWGDADVGGVRIWRYLRSRLGRPLEIFRTTAAWVEAEAPSGGRVLSGAERASLARLRSELATDARSDALAVCAMIDALLVAGRKLEQERF